MTPIDVNGPDGALSEVLKLTVPKYPDTSLKDGHQGLVVVEVIGNLEGRVDKAVVLQSPDPYIAQSALDASLLTKFRMLKIAGNQRRIKGKLYFLFQIANGKGIVLLPPFAFDSHSSR